MAPPRVMVVEDENIISKDIQHTLKNLGYEIAAAALSGKEAIQKAEETQPDLILMDIVLKGDLDGIETVERIHGRSDAPVVYLSAYNDEKTLQRAKITEPYGYLLKPFQERELHTTIEMALYKHRMEKELRKSHEELERKVEERTAELVKANETLKAESAERKRMADAMLKAAQQWRSTFDAIHDAVCLLDIDGRILKCNKAMTQITRKSSHEIINRPCWEVVHGTASPIAKCPVSQMRRSLRRETVRLPVGDRWFYVTVDPLFDETGSLVGAVHIMSDVTEQKKAEEALEESEDRYRDLVEYSQYLICTHDVEGQILSVNQEAAKLLGWDQSTLLEKNIRDLLAPEFRDGSFDEYLGTIRREGAARGVMRVKTAAGEARLWAYHSTLRIEGVAHPIVRAMAHDITEHVMAKKAVEKLSKENAIMAEIGKIISSTLNIEDVYERFADEVRKLIPFDRISIRIINLRGDTTTVAYVSGVEVENRRLGDMVPLTDTVSEECARTQSILLFQPESIEEVEQRYPTLLPTFRAGLQSMIFVPLISKDQVVGVLHIRSLKSKAYTETDLRLAERVGNQIAGAIASAQLYTERRQMEESLRRSEERFRDLFDEAPVGYYELDTEGRIIRINRTECDLLGYTADEMLGRYIWDFFEARETVLRSLTPKLKGISPLVKCIERIVMRKDGRKIPILIEERLMRDPEGKIVGIRSTMQDISDRRRMEEEKASLEEQLRQSQKMEAIGKLAGGVAHDFNNLLTVIHGYSEFALKEVDEKNPLFQDIIEIKKASEHAASLTRQLLAFGRKQVLQPEVLNLNGLILNTEKMLRRMIGEDIGLVTLLAEKLGRVKADPGQIEQVIFNLAINARDAMPQGGRLTIQTGNVELGEDYARIHIGVARGRYVMLSVSDTGRGMPPEVKERIFEPFFTTKEKGKGTGLGLSTVYGIVAQSGGTIWVASEVGQGTSFKIYLPLVEENVESGVSSAATTKPLWGSQTILLVEDEDAVRKLARLVLKKNGYKVLEASNGGEALRIFNEQPRQSIDLMLTDVIMPGMSSRQLVDRLESVQPGIKVLYMSGYTDDAIVHHGVLDPGTAYIEKPFTPDALASKVAEVLNGHENQTMKKSDF